MDNIFDEEKSGPNAADSEYDAVMAKLNASLKRSASVKSSGSVHSSGVNDSFRGGLDGGRDVGYGGSSRRAFGSASKKDQRMYDVNVDLDDNDYNAGDQLPSIEEARTHAANLLNARTDRSVNSRYSFDGEEGYDEQYDKFLRGHYDVASRKRTIPWYKIAFFALLAAIIGIIIGAVVGFRAGEDLEKGVLAGFITAPPDPMSNPANAPDNNAPYALLAPVAPPASDASANPPVDSPVASPVGVKDSRAHDVMQWLVTQGVATQTVFTETSSPQFQAAVWIADEDAAALPIPSTVGDSAANEFIERYVMVVFHYATGGDSWKYDFRFKTPGSVCTWNVDLTPPNSREIQIGVICNSDNRIININLPENNLEGTLITELGLLTGLDFLALNHNVLEGTIPSEFAELASLSYLALHYNELEGQMPDWIGNFDALRVLGMGDNEFVGPIPVTWTNLNKLVTLGLDTNSLSGNLNPLKGMLQLERVYLDGNRFEGNLADIPWFQMTNLQELDLSDNLIGGLIPSEFGTLSKLQVLDLGHNDMTGQLPSLGPMVSIQYLGLNGNRLTSSIPSSLGNLTTLAHLDLSYNEFTGRFPADLGALQKLKYLFLGNNTLLRPSEIPKFINKLTNLRDLSLRNCNRVANIEAYVFSPLTNLILLELDHNGLDGAVPSELGLLQSLTYLILGENDLSGPLPAEVQSLPELNVIALGGNSITGDLLAMCGMERKPEISVADCSGDESSAQVYCPCCTVCCPEGSNATACRDKIYLGQLDPVWENSYERRFYEFADQDFGTNAGVLPINHIGHVGNGNVLGTGDSNFTDYLGPDDR